MTNDQEILRPFAMRAEISYDLLMGDDMAFVEGVYRLPDGDWRVIIVSAQKLNGTAPQIVNATWDSGVAGVVVQLPYETLINATTVEEVLRDALGVTEWVRVEGPDSMQLR